MNFPWHLYLMATMYVIAGINHFRTPRLYLKIIPNYLPKPELLNYLSGLIEIILGVLLCFKQTSSLAAWLLILMLIVFYMTHFYMLQNKNASLGLPKWFLSLRLFLQLGLMYWAFQYTHKN